MVYTVITHVIIIIHNYTQTYKHTYSHILTHVHTQSCDTRVCSRSFTVDIICIPWEYHFDENLPDCIVDQWVGQHKHPRVRSLDVQHKHRRELWGWHGGGAVGSITAVQWRDGQRTVDPMIGVNASTVMLFKTWEKRCTYMKY